jgi:hypothetical protein
MVFAAANPWHDWIPYFLIVPIVLIIAAVIVGYVVKVVGPKYTRR